MSKKDKKEKEYKVIKITGKDIEAFERAGLNTAVLEGGNIYFLAKEKKDDDGNKYYKPVLKDGSLYVTAVNKPKAETKFEKMIASYAGACIAAGTFSSLEIVDKVAKPSMDDFLAKDKTPVNFTNVEGFLCVLPKENELMKDIKDDVKKVFKQAKSVEKFAKKEVKELYDLEDTNFATFNVSGEDQSHNMNMWDYYDSIQSENEKDEPEEEEMPDLTSEEYSEDESEEEEFEDEEYEDEEDEEEEDLDEDGEEEDEEEDLEF